jgi:hypothetical protein
VAWLSRRARLGGRCFVAVRRLNRGGDELWLYPGSRVVELVERGLRSDNLLGRWEGGPGRWDWDKVAEVLCQ